MSRALCKTVVFRCKDPQFQRWLKVDNEAAAIQKVRRICKIESRRDLDTDPAAGQRYDRLIGLPYSSFVQDPSNHTVRSNDV